MNEAHEPPLPARRAPRAGQPDYPTGGTWGQSPPKLPLCVVCGQEGEGEHVCVGGDWVESVTDVKRLEAKKCKKESAGGKQAQAAGRTASVAAMGGGGASKREAVACEHCHQMFHCQEIGRHRDACRKKAIAHARFLGYPYPN